MSAGTNAIQPNPIDLGPEIKTALEELNGKLDELNKIIGLLQQARNNLQNYILAKPKTKEQLLSNIDRESNPKEISEQGDSDRTSAKEIEQLEQKTIKGRINKLIRAKQIDEDLFYKEWLGKREDEMLGAYAKKGILGATAKMFTPTRIRKRISLAQLPEKVDDYVLNRLVKLTAQKEGEDKRKKFILKLEARRNFEFEKKKKRKESLFKTAVSIIVDSIVDKIRQRITKVVNAVKQGLISKASGSKLGRRLLNSKTRLTTSEFGLKASSAIKATKATAKSIRTGVGKAFAIGADVVKGTINVGKSLTTGALYGGTAYLVFGLNPVAGVLMGSVAGAATLGKLILGDSTLSKIGFIEKFQTNHGYGQYLLKHGGWDLDALSKTKTPIIKGWGRAFKMADAGTKWGTIGSVVGATIAVATGMPLAVGAAIGLGVGSVGGMIGDNIHTRIINSIPKGSKFLKAMAIIPGNELLGNIQTNMWIASQIDLIMGKYKGNLGQYLQENFFSGNPSKAKWENILIVSSNWINLSLGLPSVVFPTTLARAALQIGNLFAKNAPFVLSTTVKPTALASFAGQVVGTAAGAAVLSAMGVPIGAAALAGSAIGAFTGMVAGAIIAAVSGGSLSWIMFFASSVGSFIGTMIGSIFDKAVDKLSGLVNVAFGAVSAFFHLLTLMQGKLDYDSLIMIVIALIGMFQAFDRMGVFESAYQCVDVYTCNADTQPGYGSDPNIIYLANYEIGIIKDSELSELQQENLLTYLEASENMIKDQFSGKKILLNLMNDASYELPQMVILGLSKDHLDDMEELKGHMDNQLGSWALNSIPKADNIQLSLY